MILLVLIDFSKAFNSIRHNFIYDTLKFFDFGEGFFEMIKTMLLNRKCTIVINGFETNPI